MHTKRIQQFEMFVCDDCREHFYDEEHGDDDQHIVPGTLVDDLPQTYRCPKCGAPKKNLRPVLSIGSTAW